MAEKVCCGCGQYLPISSFGVAKHGEKMYLKARCNTCRASEQRARRGADIEAYRARELAYARAHAEQARHRASRYYYARYDADPVWRIELLLRKAARARRKTIERRRNALNY